MDIVISKLDYDTANITSTRICQKKPTLHELLFVSLACSSVEHHSVEMHTIRGNVHDTLTTHILASSSLILTSCTSDVHDHGVCMELITQHHTAFSVPNYKKHFSIITLTITLLI